MQPWALASPSLKARARQKQLHMSIKKPLYVFDVRPVVRQGVDARACHGLGPGVVPRGAGGHGSLEAALVGGEDGAKARQRGERAAEEEAVDERRRRQARCGYTARAAGA